MEKEPIVSGLAASRGTARGKVAIVENPASNPDIPRGSILVAPFTTPLMTMAIFRAAAIVTETGGLTSHAAIIARELGIPCVVGTENATSALRDGQEVEVDGENGHVYG